MIAAGMIAAGPAHTGLLAAIHAGAFPPEAAWDAEAFAVQLGLPGVFGLIVPTGFALCRPPPPAPLPQGEGEENARAGEYSSPPLAGGVGGGVGGSGLILARVVADQSEILTLAVVPAARRRGIGGALLRAAMRAAAERGAASLFLEVSAGNDPARSLYAAAGFREVGRRNHYYADGTDALVLARALSAGAATSG